MDEWGKSEGNARKADDGGTIGTRIANYIADPDAHEAGEVALLQQDLADFTEAASLFLDVRAVGVKGAAGTELPGFGTAVGNATPIDSLAGSLGSVLGQQVVDICTDAAQNWVAGGYQRSFVYEYENDSLKTIKVSFTVDDDLAKATSSGFVVPGKIIGIDITFKKDGLADRNQTLLQSSLKKEGDRIDYYRGGGRVLVVDPGDSNDPAWLAIKRDPDAQKGRIKVGRAHLYAKDDAGDEKGAEAVRALIDGLGGFGSGDGYKLDDGTRGVKPE
jgi:hypothetical protein